MYKVKIIGFSVRCFISSPKSISVDEAIWDEEFELQIKFRDTVANLNNWYSDKDAFSDSNFLVPTIPKNWLDQAPKFLENTILMALGYTDEIFNQVMSIAKQRNYSVKYFGFSGKQLEDAGWKFAGYDIADIELCSLLKHCPPEELVQDKKITTNQLGLLDNECEAKRICNLYGHLKHGHEPFFPTALYIEKKLSFN